MMLVSKKKKKNHDVTMNHQKMKSMTTLLLIFSVFTLLSFPTSTDAEYLAHICPNTTTFTPNSTFQSNLNGLLSTLSSNANRPTGFYSATVQTTNNAVYGLFLCRGDVAGTDTCETCVTTAISEAPQRCSIEKQVVIWYDDCLLRYSNESFFSTAAESPRLYMWNTENATDPTRFNQVLEASMNQAASEAAGDPDKFATNQANVSGLISVYSLGQCTQDLSEADCNRCLRGTIALLPSCCNGKLGGRVLFPSCNVRYEVYPFYAQNAAAPEPTPTEAVYLDEYCPDTTTFTPNSTFQSNLNRLLSTLFSNATRDTGFYHATASSSQNPYDTVYGLFLCRGDVDSTDDCKTCIATATSEALQRCPNRKNVIIWNTDCMLRYSDESFFSRADHNPLVPMLNREKVTANQSRFYQELTAIVSELAAQASYKSDKFATKIAEVSGSILMHVLGQCTQDLSPIDCEFCLRDAIAKVPKIHEGGQLLCPSCRLTIKVYGYSLRTPSSPPPLPPPPASIRARPKGRSRLSPYVIIVGSILAFIAVTVVLGYCFARRRAVRNNAPSQENGRDDTKTLESLQFDLGTIETATNKFSDNNKLGEGGFGVVFKGTLANEQEIAVKRLSKSSKQGVQEFKNEVALVAKLQHRNLVRLLGFCLEGEETILVYEYVPNQSLDYFLFESKKRERLDWSMRCMIIGGITRGILYMHEDSRLRVIHRDLKASNILLDENMNQKISDFGMARMFGVDDQTQGNTKRIVGTYGYMAPEYAMGGLYSIKSDVFSFGVLLLEIITGKKNFLGFHPTNGAPTLIGYVWKLWNEGKVLELMDPLLKGLCSPNEFLRYVHIGLLCVQEDAKDRPTMSSVVLMLKSETISLSKPERPAFFTGRCIDHHDQVAVSAHNCSVNGLTISNVVAR